MIVVAGKDPKAVAREVYALLKGSATKNMPMEKLDDAVKYYGPWEPIIEASNGHLAFGQFGMIEIAGRFK